MKPQVAIPPVPLSQLVFGTLAVTAVAALFWLLFRYHNLILLLLAAILLSTAIKPGVLWLERRGLPKAAGVVLIYGLFLLMVGLLVAATAPVLSAQGTAMSQSLREGYSALLEGVQRLPNVLVRRLAANLPAAAAGAPLAETAVPAEEIDLGQAWAQLRLALYSLFNVIAVFILALFWTLEGERVKQAALLLVPLSRRAGARALVREMEAKVSGYLLGQGLLCLIISGMALLAYALIGLPYAFLLAVFAGLMEAVPILGPFLGAVPAVIVGLSISPLTAVWVVIATVIIQQLENNLLVPRVMTRAVGVRPLVTLLALLAFGSLFGILGALIALPLAAVLQLLLDRFLLDRESLAREEPGRDQLSILRYETNQLVQDVRHHIRRKEEMASAASDALEDEVEAIALDLESFLARQGAAEVVD